MMQLRVTPPNGGKPIVEWFSLSFTLDEVERFSWAGATIEILSVRV
jgi:hypothetical protein